MALFLLIRHGEADGNRTAQVMGHAPIPLNAKGREQAKKVAELISSFQIDHLFSSPILRALQTAEIIAKGLKLKIAVEKALQEVHYGDWEGRYYHELPQDAFYCQLVADPIHTAFPGGESLGDVQARGVKLVEQFSKKFSDQTIALVSHGDPIRGIVAHYLNIPLSDFRKIRIDNGSISTLEVINSKAEFKTINQVTSLEPCWRERGPWLNGKPI
ncbi:MAG: histidine phosphatase family protein [Deltaproteobacteria bacterium]|nr:histidine phosphatase family protein [Deltaproteobacteria bacterium]